MIPRQEHMGKDGPSDTLVLSHLVHVIWEASLGVPVWCGAGGGGCFAQAHVGLAVLYEFCQMQEGAFPFQSEVVQVWGFRPECLPSSQGYPLPFPPARAVKGKRDGSFWHT